MAHRSIGIVHYLVTWVILMVLGGLSYALADLGVREPWPMVIALSIATLKAALVALVFMHLLTERGSVRVAALAGLGFVVLLVLLTTIDVAART